MIIQLFESILFSNRKFRQNYLLVKWQIVRHEWNLIVRKIYMVKYNENY